MKARSTEQYLALLGGLLLGTVARCAMAAEPAPPVSEDHIDQQQLVIVEAVRIGRPGAIARLRDEFAELLYDHQEYALKVLECRRSPEARRLLGDIACGRIEPRGVWDVQAAYGLYESLDDRGDACQMFAAANWRVREQVLGWLRKDEVKVDEKMLAALRPLLQDSHLRVRSQAAAYLAMATGSAPPRKKAEVLIQSAATVQKAKDAQQRAGFYDGVGERWTEADFAYMDLITALIMAEGIDSSLLRELLPKQSGPSRDCVLIALGLRGDRSVKTEMWRIIRECKVTMLRSQALGVIGKVGDVSDIPRLQRLTVSDPLAVQLTPAEMKVMKMQRPDTVRVPATVFPLREKAMRIIKELQGRGGPGLGRGSVNSIDNKSIR